MGRRTSRPGEQPRASVERPVALRFKHLEDFVDELTANVSAGGMFIRTGRPHPVGSVFEFELRPGGDLPPIAGKAQVAWVRRRAATDDRPAGMGVRFVELDDESRRRVAELTAADALVTARPGDEETADEPAAPAAPAGGGAAATRPAAAPAAGGAAATLPAPAPPAGRVQSVAARRPGRRLAWGLLVVLLAALAAALWWPPAAAGPDTAGTEAAATDSAAAAGPSPAAGEPQAAPAANAPPADTPPARPAQLRLVDDWARAWSEQRIDDYMAAYSASFTPDGGLDRAAWERQRRGRILAPLRIEVALALVELERLDADSSRVRFVQAYESDSYRDVVRKVLELELEPGGWKIVRESVEG